MGRAKTLLIYTCEECGAEFARKYRPAAPILCKLVQMAKQIGG